jgi:excisionase family DNA binding protein
MTEPRKYLRRAEAAEYMSVTPATIDRWVKEGRLTRYRLAGHAKVSRYDKADLDALVKPVVTPVKSHRVY